MIQEYSDSVLQLSKLSEIAKNITNEVARDCNISEEVIQYMNGNLEKLLSSDNKIKVTPKSTRGLRHPFKPQVPTVKVENEWSTITFAEYECEYSFKYALTYGYALKLKGTNTVVGYFNGEECYPFVQDNINDKKSLAAWGFNIGSF